MDGVWDRYHWGHVAHFRHCQELDGVPNFLIVGVISDKDAESYKRRPLFDEVHRSTLVASCRYVDEVISSSPLVLTEDFIRDHHIDVVCHAFADEQDDSKQNSFFEVPKTLGIFRSVPYNAGVSTTQLLEMIKEERTRPQ